MNLQELSNLAHAAETSSRMPSLFVGHGNPMNAILDNSFSKTWGAIGKQLPRPNVILSISAHWLTRHATKVTAMKRPKTIHDFAGFPQQLYVQQYPASGSPKTARQVQQLVRSTEVGLDYDWGLDHGTWSVLLHMFPLADIPVFQFSIDYSQPPEFHYELGKKLKQLRDNGVLIIGSGNIVHNLHAAKPGTEPRDWALEFDQRVATWLQEEDHRSLVNFQSLGSLASKAQPTYDHYLPLLYVIGVQDNRDSLEFFNNDIDMSSVSMRSVLYR